MARLMYAFLLWVLQKSFALQDELVDNIPLGLKLVQGLLLAFNQLIHILNTAGSDFTGGAEHDTVEELNVRLELITVGVALPVEIHLDLGLQDIGDEVLVLGNEFIELLDLLGPLLLSTLSHDDLQDLLEPFLDLSSLQILAQGLKKQRCKLQISWRKTL